MLQAASQVLLSSQGWAPNTVAVGKFLWQLNVQRLTYVLYCSSGASLFPGGYLHVKPVLVWNN